MTNKAKIIAVFTAIICIFSQYMVFSNDTIVEDYRNVSTEIKAVDYLVLLGIIGEEDAESFLSEDKITKGEAAYLIIKALGLYEIAKTTSIYDGFKDFTPGQKYANIVSVAVSKGILSGESDGTLNLAGEITLEQASKMLIMALGYDYRAQSTGGYPNGYIQAANHIRILRNINASIGMSISKNAFAKILYNSLEVDVLGYSGYSGGDIIYDSDGTLKNIYLDSYDLIVNEGVVQATKQTSILNQDLLMDNDVIVDGLRMDINGTKLGSYIGYTVQYVAELKEEYSIAKVLRFSMGAKNVVNYLVRDNEAYISNGKINYVDAVNGRERSFKLNSEVVYIYNNRKLTSFSSSLLDFKRGVKLIDNNDDSEIDIVTWTVSESYIVDNVNDSNEMIYLKDGSVSIDLTELEERSLVVREIDGEPLDWRLIQSKDAISVIESLDKRYLEIILLAPPILGQINEMEDDEWIVISGKRYGLSPQLKDEIEVGRTGKFFINEKDELFKFETGVSDYIYIIDKSMPTNLDSNMKIKVYDNYTGIKIYDVDDKIKIDTITYNSSVFNRIPTDVVASLTVNSSGVVKEINTAKPYGGRVDRKYCKYAHAFNEGVIKDSNGTATGAYDEPFKFNEDTMFFVVPQNKSDEDFGAVPDYKDGTPYNTQAYECDPDTDFVKAIVISFNAADFVKDDPKVGIVSKVSNALDKDMQSAYFITGFSEGKEFKYIATVNSNVVDTVSRLKKGDVIRFNKNYSDEIIKLEILASLTTQNDYIHVDRDGGNELFFGNVMLLRKSAITDLSKYLYHVLEVNTVESYSNMTTMRIYAHIRNTENDQLQFDDYYIYDRSKDSIIKAGIDDLISFDRGGSSASKVFIHRNSTNAKILVIVKD